MRDEERDQRSKVPLLGDIPWLGRAFSTVSETHGQTELLIFITPRVATSVAEGQSITDDETERMRQRFDSKYLEGDEQTEEEGTPPGEGTPGEVEGREEPAGAGASGEDEMMDELKVLREEIEALIRRLEQQRAEQRKGSGKPVR